MNFTLRIQFILISSFLFLFVSCSSESNEIDVPDEIAALENVAIYSGEDEPLYDISLERQARFGDTDDVYIGSMAGVAVMDNGTFFWLTVPRLSFMFMMHQANIKPQLVVRVRGRANFLRYQV